MAEIRPFCAVRPRRDLASRIAALPYDVYSRREAAAIVKENPRSFLKIDRAEVQLGDEVDTYDPRVYRKAADTLWQMLEQGELVQDKEPCLYLYELTMEGRTQTGVCCCTAVREYENGRIRRHENTRKEKEEDRVCHVETCRAQTGPIFLACRDRDGRLAGIQEKEKQAEPLYDFTAEDGVRHRLWKIGSSERIERIRAVFGDIPALYIADGHHRAASAVRVAEKFRAQQSSAVPTGLEQPGEAEYVLSVIFPADQLKILDYNRWVADLNGRSPAGFLEELGRKFLITPVSENIRPEKKGDYSMYLDGRWYRLRERNPRISRDPVKLLDVSVLQEQILDPVLGIKDPKTDSRIRFVGGIRGTDALEKMVAGQGGVAFALYPTSIEELFAVADQGRLMPPKSTWFEPKLRSGLLIHRI